MALNGFKERLFGRKESSKSEEQRKLDDVSRVFEEPDPEIDGLYDNLELIDGIGLDKLHGIVMSLSFYIKMNPIAANAVRLILSDIRIRIKEAEKAGIVVRDVLDLSIFETGGLSGGQDRIDFLLSRPEAEQDHIKKINNKVITIWKTLDDIEDEKDWFFTATPTIISLTSEME